MIFPHTMPLSRADKEEIRTRVLLELNAAFVNIAGISAATKIRKLHHSN